MSLTGNLRKMGILLDQNWKKNVSNTDVLKHNKNNSTYSIEESKPLIFKNINVGRHIKPNIDLGSSDLTIKLCSNICLETKDKTEVLKSLGVNFLVGGECFVKETEEVKDLCFAFHLDYDKNGKSDFYHPICHLQYGGKEMDNPDFGSLLKIEQPRFSHYPMDVILAIDFIIHNFYTIDQHIKFTNLPAYRSLVNESATKYIKPYIEGIYSYWSGEFEDNSIKSYDAICSLPKH